MKFLKMPQQITSTGKFYIAFGTLGQGEANVCFHVRCGRVGTMKSQDMPS